MFPRFRNYRKKFRLEFPLKSKSWWYSFFAAYKALCMANANVGSNAYTGTVV